MNSTIRSRISTRSPPPPRVCPTPWVLPHTRVPGGGKYDRLEGRHLGKVVELRCCDICQRLTLRRKLRIYCDMLLCRDCFQRYGYS